MASAIDALVRKTRLFHTLIIVGAAMTGGGLATVSVTVLPGCGNPTSPVDMSVGYPDIGMPPVDGEFFSSEQTSSRGGSP